MKIHRAYKVKLYPNKRQEQELVKILGACRFVYNYFLAARIGYYKESGKTLSYMHLSRDLTQLRKAMWLGEFNQEPLAQSLRRLDGSYRSFFKEKKGFPMFKSKKSSRQSFQTHQGWRVKGNRIQIQKDLQIKFRGTLNMEDKFGTLVVCYRAGGWYATITAQSTVNLPKQHTKPIGLDVGLTTLVTTSSGMKFENIQPQKANQKTLTRAQRNLSRKKKGSNRYVKAKSRVARTYEKIANVRHNHLHQVSSAITRKNHALIAVEDLNVKGMVRNRHLARAISDASWSELLRQIEYKQTWRGGTIVKVDRYFPSSKLCSVCDFLSETMPLSVREWKCGGCGNTHDRDINAAKNILKQALAYRVRGADVRPSRQLALKRGQQ